MVTDASRFTTLAEAMTPAELSEFLDRYFAILFGVVERYGGVVTDVVGDGTTSVWTAPGPERSCRLRVPCRARDQPRDRGVQRAQPAADDADADRSQCRRRDGRQRRRQRPLRLQRGRRLREHGVPAPDPEQEGGHRIIAAAAVVEGLEEIVSRPLGSSNCAARTAR